MKAKTKDQVEVHLDSLHIFDYHNCVLVGQPTEATAERATIREVDRIFGEEKPLRIVGPLVNRKVCMVYFSCYERWNDADGSHLIIVFSLRTEDLHTVFERAAMSISEIEWETTARTFLI